MEVAATSWEDMKMLANRNRSLLVQGSVLAGQSTAKHNQFREVGLANARLTEQLDIARADLLKLKQASNALLSARLSGLDDDKAKIEAIVGDFGKAESRHDTFATHLAEASSKHGTLVNDLDGAKGENSTLVGQLGEASTKNKELLRELDGAKGENKTLAGKLGEASTKNGDLGRELDATRTAFRRHQELLFSARLRLYFMISNSDAIEDRLITANSKLTETTRKEYKNLQIKSDENRTLSNDAAALLQEKHGFKQRIVVVGEERNGVQDDLCNTVLALHTAYQQPQEWRRWFQSRDTTCIALNHEADSLFSALNEERERESNAKLRNIKTDLGGKLDRQVEIIKRLQNDITELGVQQNAKAEELKEKGGQLTRLQEQLDEECEVVQEVNEELKKKGEELAGMGDELRERDGKLEKKRKKLAKIDKALEKERETVQGQDGELKKEGEELAEMG